MQKNDKSDPHTHLHTIDYNSFYPSMFPLGSPSEHSSVEDAEVAPTTESCLNEASLVLEYQQLYNRYAMCLSHLHDSLQQIDFLRDSYDAIRVANADLVKRMNLMSQGFGCNCLADDLSCLSLEEGARNSPTRMIEQRNRFGQPQRSGRERVTLPKSISVRSSGYMPPQRSGGSNVPSRRHRVKRAPAGFSGSQRVCVPAAGGEKEQSALEFEVYNQGMFKTELCNKWQETGACPYGENCQFAHGITELRPVIRHPRYKTEVCRMVLAG